MVYGNLIRGRLSQAKLLRESASALDRFPPSLPPTSFSGTFARAKSPFRTSKRSQNLYCVRPRGCIKRQSVVLVGASLTSPLVVVPQLLCRNLSQEIAAVAGIAIVISSHARFSRSLICRRNVKDRVRAADSSGVHGTTFP